MWEAEDEIEGWYCLGVPPRWVADRKLSEFILEVGAIAAIALRRQGDDNLRKLARHLNKRHATVSPWHFWNEASVAGLLHAYHGLAPMITPRRMSQKARREKVWLELYAMGFAILPMLYPEA